jgi:porin
MRNTFLLMLGAMFFMNGMLAAQETTAEEPPPAHGFARILEADRDGLTDGWFGLGRRLEEHGIEMGLGLTQIYQIPLQGGGAENSWGKLSSLHRHEGRYTGSFDLELSFDFDKLLRIPGATFYLHAAGGWSDGIGDSAVGAIMDPNADAYGDQVIDLVEAFWEQAFFDGRVITRVGKLDLTGGFECQGCPVAFDGNAYANDETAQFLNSALVNNPTIPFPDYAIGATVYVEPIDGVYLSAGAADAQADGRETGFNTAFHDEDYWFAIFETGLAGSVKLPWSARELPGAYRVGFWYDPQDKERFVTGTTKRDDVGFYLSFDQALFFENEHDDQGLGAFFRYGWADRDVSDFTCFWSTGLQYVGAIPCRDDDVIGVGYANGKRGADPGATAGREQVWEFYYNAKVTSWLNVTPNLQVIKNPGLRDSVGDAVVLGVRAQLEF